MARSYPIRNPYHLRVSDEIAQNDADQPVNLEERLRELGAKARALPICPASISEDDKGVVLYVGKAKGSATA